VTVTGYAPDDWLSRDSGSRCPQPEQICDVYAAGTFSTRPGALSASRRASRPQPDRRISRLSPAFARTFRPGLPCVRLAERGHVPDLNLPVWRPESLCRDGDDPALTSRRSNGNDATVVSCKI